MVCADPELNKDGIGYPHHGPGRENSRKAYCAKSLTRGHSARGAVKDFTGCKDDCNQEPTVAAGSGRCGRSLGIRAWHGRASRNEAEK